MPIPPRRLPPICRAILASVSCVSAVACGIARYDDSTGTGGSTLSSDTDSQSSRSDGMADPIASAIGAGGSIPSSDTDSPSSCSLDRMADPIARAVASTASGSGEPDTGAVLELSVEVPSLAGIECLVNLERLQVGGPLPDDELLRLVPLQKLRELVLLGPVSLVPLARLPQVTYLSVNSNDTEDLSPLAQLPALERLELTGMLHLETMSPLGEITSLRSLYIFDVQTSGVVHDHSFLAGLQLEELSVHFTSGVIDFANVNTSRLRRLALLGIDAKNLPEIGPPSGPPAQVFLDPADFTVDYPDIVAALCPLGWCVVPQDSSSANVDPSCSDACELAPG